MIKLNVEEILKRKGKTKTWLCDQMDITHYNLNKALKGNAKSISYKYLEGFGRALGCTFDELLTIIDDKEDVDKHA